MENGIRCLDCGYPMDDRDWYTLHCSLCGLRLTKVEFALICIHDAERHLVSDLEAMSQLRCPDFIPEEIL